MWPDFQATTGRARMGREPWLQVVHNGTPLPQSPDQVNALQVRLFQDRGRPIATAVDDDNQATRQIGANICEEFVDHLLDQPLRALGDRRLNRHCDPRLRPPSRVRCRAGEHRLQNVTWRRTDLPPEVLGQGRVTKDASHQAWRGNPFDSALPGHGIETVRIDIARTTKRLTRVEAFEKQHDVLHAGALTSQPDSLGMVQQGGAGAAECVDDATATKQALQLGCGPVRRLEHRCLDIAVAHQRDG